MLAAGRARQLGERFAAHLGEQGRGLHDQRRLVAAAAIRDRGEERRVGLDHEAVARHEARGVAQRVGGLEGDDAAERDVEAEVEEAARAGGVAGEAVDDAAGLARALCLHDGDGVVVGVAQMHDDRQAQPARQLDEARETPRAAPARGECS